MKNIQKDQQTSQGNQMSQSHWKFLIVSDIARKTDFAVELVSKESLSTKRASSVSKSPTKSGVEIQPPSQSGVWITVIKEGERQKESNR